MQSNYRSAFKVMALSLLIMASAVSPSRADSWAAPFLKEYCSANHQFCFTVAPQTKPLAPATGSLASTQPAQQLWSRRLLNPYAPVSVLVSDTGKYVATFDDWGRVGYGEQVVVIYGPEGKLIRRFSLEDLMTLSEIEAYTLKSVSSRWWGGLHRIDEAKQELVLEIANDADAIHKPARETIRFRDLRIDLKTGKILTP